VSDGFEEVQGADDVDVDRPPRVGGAFGHVCLRRQVEDEVGLRAVDDRSKLFVVADVA
jgi:hypothetical protein